MNGETMQYVRSYGWKQSSLVCLVLATLAAGEVFAQQSQVVPGQPYVVEAPLVPTSGEMSGQVPYAAGQVLTATGQPHLQRPYPDNSATSLPPLPTMVQHAANWQIGESQRRRLCSCL